MLDDATVTETRATSDAEAALRALGATLIWHTATRRMADGLIPLEIARVESGCYAIWDVPYFDSKAQLFCRWLPRQFGVTFYTNPTPGSHLVSYNYRLRTYRSLAEARAGCEHHCLVGNWAYTPPSRPPSVARLLLQSSVCAVTGIFCAWAVVRGPRGKDFIPTALLIISVFLIPAACYKFKEALLLIRHTRKRSV